MKIFNCFSMRNMSIILIFVFVIIVAGCTSNATNSQNTPPQSTPVTPAITPIQTFQTNEQKATTQTITNIPDITMSASLPYGITVFYPQDWTMEETSNTSMRDYGRNTINIANFYSPDITLERSKNAMPNPDLSTYTTLSIDIDPEPTKDFEQYFNLAVLALQKYYPYFDITKHNYQLNISVTDTHPGYKSYQLDFDTYAKRGTYIFTNVDGTVYIFAFDNPTPYSKEVRDMYKAIRIIPQVTIQKSR